MSGYSASERLREAPVPPSSEEYLLSIRPSSERCHDFIAPEGPMDRIGNGWVYDNELGWTLVNAHRAGSIDGSLGVYTYDPPLPGAVDRPRAVINDGGLRSCRIHTFGDSFTHCDQVSDGETWQEFLAAHLREPVKNFGVGGYSVFQAFRRMQRVELSGPEVASLVILNIYDDDHFRNLDALRSIRSPGTGQPFTLPHIRVDLKEGTCEPVENLCPTTDEIIRLAEDDDWLLETFKHDAVLGAVLATRAAEAHTNQSDDERMEFERLSQNNVNFGLGPTSDGDQNAHTSAALLATQYVVTQAELLCEQIGAQLMLVLSFSEGNMLAALNGQPRFDEPFLASLKEKTYPIIDTRDVFAKMFASSGTTGKEFLQPYYIGHHTPLGNFVTAQALKDTLVEMLEPKPLPYSKL